MNLPLALKYPYTGWHAVKINRSIDKCGPTVCCVITEIGSKKSDIVQFGKCENQTIFKPKNKQKRIKRNKQIAEQPFLLNCYGQFHEIFTCQTHKINKTEKRFTNHISVQFWRFGKCGVQLHYHYSHVHLGLEWYYLLGSHLWFKIICIR